MIVQESFDTLQFKKLLLETFEAFINTCSKYQLNYFCAGGTVLGGVRHKGLIPWDDDIDVFMPREDYEKLIDLDSQISKNGFSVIAARNTKQYATFAKFYNRNTTLWELKEIPFVYGIYIDIFPLDESNDTLDVFLRKYRRLRNAQRWYQLSQMRFSLHDVFSYLRQGDRKYFVKGVLSFFFPRFTAQWFRRYLLKVEDCFKGQKGDHIVCPYGEYYAKEYQKKEWYEKYSELPFEHLSVRMPADYDAFLRHVYGDYMKLPPKEKQISHHYHYFLDMNQGITLEDAKRKIGGYLK